MAGYVKYGLSVAKGGEEGAEARKERAAAARASAMENFANFVNSMPKPESSWLEKAQAWIAGEGAPPEQTEPSQLDNLQSTVTKAVQDYQLSQEQIQQQINDEATELMKKKFAIPSLSGVVDSEKVKAFLMGQATTRLGRLGTRAKTLAINNQPIPKDLAQEIKELETISAYKSPDEGFSSWVDSAVKMIGQQAETAVFTPAQKNPYAIGVGFGVLNPAAGAAAGTAAMVRNTAEMEGGNMWLDFRKLKHSDGSKVTDKEAAVLSDIGGSINGILETVGFSKIAATVPGLRKFIGKGAMGSATVKDAMLKWAKKWASAVGTETFTDGLQELPNVVGAAILEDKDVGQPLLDPKTGEQVLGAMGEAFKATALLAGAGSAHGGYKSVRELHAERRALNAEQNAKEVPQVEPNVKTAPEETPPAPEAGQAENLPKVEFGEMPKEEKPSKKKKMATAPPIETVAETTTESAAPQQVQEQPTVDVNPIETPAALANSTQGEVPLNLPPVSEVKNVDLLEEFSEDEGYPTTQFDDGTAMAMPKRLWKYNEKTPKTKVLAALTRPAILMNEGTIIIGPEVNKVSPTREIISDYDALINSRRATEQRAINRGYFLTDQDDGTPSDVKDVGFVSMGTEGTPIAGQFVWLSNDIVDQKLVPKSATERGITTLKDYIRERMGEKYEKALKAQQEKESVKEEPLSPEETEILNRPYLGGTAKSKGKKQTLDHVAQGRIVKSLKNSGFDETELASVVQTASADAARSVAKEQGKSPAEQQRLFFNRLRGFTLDQVKKAKGQSRRQHEAGIGKEVPIKTVENVQDVTEASVREEETEVKTKVKSSTPIKKAQAKAEAADTSKKPPIRTKIYTPEEISKLTGQPVEQIRAAQQKKQGQPPVQEKIVEPPASPAMERRNLEYIPTNKTETVLLFPATSLSTQKLIGYLKRDDKLVVRSNGDVTFAKFNTAETEAKKIVGTVIPTNKMTYVVSTEPRRRVEFTLNAIKEEETQTRTPLEEARREAANTQLEEAKKAGLPPKAIKVAEGLAERANVETVKPKKATTPKEEIRSEAVAALQENDEIEEYTMPADAPSDIELVQGPVTPVIGVGRPQPVKEKSVGQKRAERMTKPRVTGPTEITAASAKSIMQDAVRVTGVKGPQLADNMVAVGIRDDSIVVKKDGTPVFNGITGIRLQMKRGRLSGVPIEVGDNQYIIVKDGVDLMDFTQQAEEYVRPMSAPATPVNKVGGNVPAGPTVQESLGRTTPEETKPAKKKRKAKTKQPPVVMGSDKPLETVAGNMSAASMGDTMIVSTTSRYQATVFNPETNVVISVVESNKEGKDGLKDVVTQAREVAKDHKITRTIISGSESDSPSNTHQIIKVVDKGYNPLANQKGQDNVLVPGLVNGVMQLYGTAKRIGQAAARALDVEYYWTRRGLDEIGFTIKNYFSRRDVEEKKGMQKAIEIQNEVKKGFPNPTRDDLLDVVLAAEDINHLSTMDVDRANKVRPAAEMLRKYFDDSKQEFADRGLNLDFKNNQIARLKERIAETVNEEQKAEFEVLAEELAKTDMAFGQSKAVEKGAKQVQKLVTRREKLEKNLAAIEQAEFVHIPYRMIFQKRLRDYLNTQDILMRKKKFAELRSLLAAKRHANTIRELLDKKDKNGDYIIDVDELNPVNIVMNYAYNKGQDHALLDIRDAIKQYDKTFKIAKTRPKTSKDGYEWKKIDSPKLSILKSILNTEKSKGKHLWVRTDVLRAITEALNYQEKQTKWDKFMALSKMTAFYNPFILPMYNTLQSIRGTTISLHHPVKTLKAFHKAIGDIGGLRTIVSSQGLGYSQDYIEALENGLASKPFSNPFEGWRSFADQINTGKNGSWYTDWLRAFKSEFTHSSPLAKATLAVPVLKSFYKASWSIAWNMDELFRMQMYNYLKAEGHTPRGAATIASQMQGDYASVPAQTRKLLNKFFFTPTFKIATLKLYGKTMKEAIKVSYEMIRHPITWKERTTKRQRRYTMAALMVGAINMGFDMLLVEGMGFERDSWGRRYRKRIIDEHGKAKDFMLTFATSENVPQRYLERVFKAMEPGVANPFMKFLELNKWELHPVYRNAYAAISGNGDEGSVYSANDPVTTKAAKGIWYFTRKTLSALDAVQRTEWAVNKKEREQINKTWDKEYGKGMGLVYKYMEDLFGYAYITEPEKKRQYMRLRQMDKQFMKEAYESIRRMGIVDPALREKYKNEKKRVIQYFKES